MSALAKIMNHSNQSLLLYSVMRAKSPLIDQESPFSAKPGKGLVRSEEFISCVCVTPEELKTPKTAWEHYNEGT